ncbi:LacI family DNA-binding transcriptional regulator [Sphingobacterium sp. Mn56C]|uniref:LacI family DNA-binding transcriptional regulator n=1 Tax=Sphingobacterium sp. Mn56C TaxID=3395261 RepID=UPI003BC6D460
MKRTTIKDLAKYLSLSTSTISRAFIPNSRIHPDTKEKIVQAAAKLGYKPDPIALNLRYGVTKTIGLIVPEMVTPFTATVLQGIERVLRPLGYRILINVSDEDPEMERQHLLFLEGMKVDGILINACHESHNLDLYKDIMDRGMPLVFFDRRPNPTLTVSQVGVNDAIKASLMVEHLIETGKKRIVYLMGPVSIRNTVERGIGYERILKKYNMYAPELLVKLESLTVDAGKEAVQKLYEQGISFDAIFAFTDTLAIGAMNYLLQQGVNIPAEVAVGSFSGTVLSTMVHPQLTTVEQPLSDMGHVAANLLLEQIKDPKAPLRTEVMDAMVVRRASTMV